MKLRGMHPVKGNGVRPQRNHVASRRIRDVAEEGLIGGEVKRGETSTTSVGPFALLA